MQTKSTPGDDTCYAPGAAQPHARFGTLIGRVYRQWRRQIDLHFKALGLSDATRMPLLELYAHEQPLRQKDLADALYLDTSSLVRVLDQLRLANLVDWSTDPADRRIKRIALTDQGRHTASILLARSLDIERAILADITPADLDTTRSSLQKISARFETLNGN